MRPFSIVLLLLVASVGWAQERVTLSPKDGHPLIGSFLKPASGAPKGGVVLLPAAKSMRIVFDPLLTRFAQAGIAAVAIEPRYDVAEVESAPSRPTDGGAATMDLVAALEFLAERGAPVDKLAIVGAGAGSSLAVEYAARSGKRVKAIVLLAPGRDGTLPSKESLAALTSHSVYVIMTADEAEKGAKTLKELLPAAEVQTLEDRLASGTGMFGRIHGIESTIADWVGRAVAQPSGLEIPESKVVLNDGEVSPTESAGAATISVPLGESAAATIRLTHSKRTLDIGFDVPEPYVRLNEVIVYIDSAGRGSRLIDNSCYRISYNPKNPARKPLLVQRGGLKGFEDTDDKGVNAHAHTEQKRHWSAEISLDLSRFAPGDLPKNARLGFQVNGQRMSDVRYYPDDAKVPTSPGAWLSVRIQ
jgi:dienelactone hydrolase